MLDAAAASRSSRRSKPSLPLTCRVHARSWSSGTGRLIRDSVPTIIASELGYHAVGISPRMRPGPASTTARSLLPELATYKVFPSRSSASASGLEPTCAPA